MGAVISSSSCCAQRDRNDKEVDIELRNDKFFMFNYPMVIKEIDKKQLEEKPDVAFFRRVQAMLIQEIAYNKR